MNWKVDSQGRKRVTLIEGDGIGPEVIGAAVRVVEATGAPIAWERRQAGASVFRIGVPSGVAQDTIESIRETRVVFKGPLETPVGYGEKSANVTLRKLFETFANIRPVREMPGVQTPYSGRKIDIVVVRENVEDLYAGIEHMQTPGVAQCLKLMTKKGCERIVRTAFEVARSQGRKKVHCATKANIMKFTEGLLKRTFEEVAQQYPDIEAQHIIVDNCAHMLVKHPENFDVIVTSNMNGDILSDLTSGLIGGLGFAPSANLGNDIAIFEAVHGSAPKYAGTNLSNPTAVILTAVMLLRYLDENAAADAIENAVMVTLESGAYTHDVSQTGNVTTTEFTDRVIANLGRQSSSWKIRDHQPLTLPTLAAVSDYVKVEKRETIGVDIFIESAQKPQEIGFSLSCACEGTPFKLKMISNRGTKVFPNIQALTDCVDHWRCRFVRRANTLQIGDSDILDLLRRVTESHSFMHVEKLGEFNGKPNYTLAQGEDLHGNRAP